MTGRDRLSDQLCAALEAHLQTGARPRPPEAGMPLWQAFCALSRARTYHAAGANPISFEAIDAWARMMRLPLEPGHVRIIAAMDDTWLRHANARRAAPDGVKTLQQRSSQPLTPALLDIVMG